MTLADTPTTPHHAAQALAALGWHLVPIAPGKKHPAGLNNWQHDATDDLDTINQWWNNQFGGHGLGVTTGHRSAIWALDIDTHDGLDGYEALAELIGTTPGAYLPDTCQSATGGGGAHIIFKWDPNRPITNGMATALPAGLDIRGEGGQIVLPPTVHPSGQPYQWIDDPWTVEPADAPEWLYGLLLAEPEPDPPRPIAATPPPRANGHRHTDDGETPAEWINTNYDWHQLLNSDGWTEHSAPKAGQTWWTRPGKATKDGHSAVLHEPDGPLVIFTTALAGLADFAAAGTTTSDGSGVSVSLFGYIAATRHHGDRSAAARAARAEMGGAQAPPVDIRIADHQAAEVTAEEPAIDHRAELKAATLAKFLTGTDVLELPPPQPMVGQWLDRGVIASMPGKFGSGKSFMLLDLALSVASGIPWYGETIEHTGPVWYVIAEGAYTAADRVRAWATRHGAPVPDDFMIYPYRFDLADNGESWAGLRWLLEDHIDDGMQPPALIVLDTYSQLTSGDEKPETTKAALEAMYVLRDISGASVAFAHHTGHKTEGRGRGDSTLEDNIDVVFPIHGRLHDENGRLVPVKLTNTKQKSRAAQQPKWLKLELTEGGLPYLTLAAGPDPDQQVGPRPLEKLLQYIAEHPGEYSSREISRSDEPVGIAGLGISQRDRGQLVLQLLRLGAIEVCGKDGKRDLLGPTGVELVQVERSSSDDEF